MSEVTPRPDSIVRAARGGGLLATKLYARAARANLVARPRLTRLLDGARSDGLILVSAPAGFGKTTLLADWIEGRPRRACWLSLDAADNDPARFLSYVIAALQGVAPGVADLAGPLRSPEPPAVEAVLAALVNELSLVAEALILVLDDYHVITSPAVSGALTFLLENLPPNLQVIVSSRADPPIPIARLRSRGQVVEIRTDDLRFTPGEAAEFLGQTMGLTLSSGQAAALGERAEGWVAGLQMAALSLRGRQDVDAFIATFAGTNRFILDFLVEEVLSREPDEVQAFLLQTAVLNRLCGPLCDAVTGRADGRQMLERLERGNLFVVPLDDDRRWYRYHHLFADLLRARLRQSEHGSIAGLMSRASDWCEQQGQAAEAVEYALAARDYPRAGDLIGRCWGSTVNSGEVETAWSWLAALPENMVRESAPLSVACCWVLWLSGQVAAIETHLVDAECALSRSVLPEGSSAPEGFEATLPAQAATLRSIVCRYGGEVVAACTHAERALTLLPEGLSPETQVQVRTLIYLALASAYEGAGDLERSVHAYAETIRCSRMTRNGAGVAGMTYRQFGVLRLLGRLRAAEAACREAFRFMEEHGMARFATAGVLHVVMADLLLERNEAEAAEGHLARAHELARRSGRFDAVRNAASVSARLCLARDDVAGALAAIEQAEAALGEPPPPLMKAELLALRAGVLLRQGSPNAAVRYTDEASRLVGEDRGITGEMVALVALRAQIARSRPEEAVALATQALRAAEERNRLAVALETRIIRSLALWRQGAAREALSDVQRALALAEPEGYLRIFVDEGEPLADLLRMLATHPPRADAAPGYSAGYLAALLTALGVSAAGPSAPGRAEHASPTGPAAALIEPLSERELEVLRLMAEGLTNAQIAARLIIALGTVKAHVHNISGKLEAQNRAHAIARARELGLL